MAAYVLGDGRAAEKCVEWLEDWVKHNPPYRGWNWTSALEVGMRLVQFTWMDALLTATSVASGKSALRESDGPPSPRPSPPGEGETSSAPGDAMRPGASGTRIGEHPLPGGEGWGEGGRTHQITERLERLRREILPPHAWYAWRHRSFGSSANNHLIGELAGLVLATVRWPALAQWGAPLDELQRRWEHEVLAQFAEDGGNKEQALNYHLFSWEFCWQARMALAGAGREISLEVHERLQRTAQFFVDVQVPSDPWDYGDSDSAYVMPLFADDSKVVAEWHEWFRSPNKEQALEFWMGAARRDLKLEISDFEAGEWHYAESGYAMRREGDWTLRWDLSPLGLGTMAAHGHLDALHVSLWLRGVAMVIDPGTGAYYAGKQLRNWLGSREAHNGICILGTDWIRRLGDAQMVTRDNFAHAQFVVPNTTDVMTERIIKRVSSGFGYSVTELWERPKVLPPAFSVRWQFAPDSRIEALAERDYRITRLGVSMDVQLSADWAEVFCVTEQSQVAKADPDAPLAGTVSPAFRKTVWAPYLKLVARPRGDKPCVFSTTFLASAGA
jgi:hypothetical protein